MKSIIYGWIAQAIVWIGFILAGWLNGSPSTHHLVIIFVSSLVVGFATIWIADTLKGDKWP